MFCCFAKKPLSFETIYQLYYEAFEDSEASLLAYFEIVDWEHSYYLQDPQSKQLIAMCLNTSKNISIEKEVKKVLSISAVCTTKKFQKQGYSKYLLQEVVKKEKTNFDYLFLQAYNYDFYNYLNFVITLEKKEAIILKNYVNYFQMPTHLDLSNFEHQKHLFFLYQNYANKHKIFWKMSFEEFIKYWKYKMISENLQTWFTKDAFIAYNLNSQVFHCAYLNPSAFINITKTFGPIFKNVRFLISAYDEKELRNLIEIKKEKTIILKTNKKINENTNDFYFWDYFV